ncbi:MAG TPA: trehalase family glycosidase [Bryobacteraceae bacterium]
MRSIRIAAAALLLAVAAPSRQIGILEYIRATWTTLTRSNRALASAAVDPKFQPEPDGRWPVYVPASEDLAQLQQSLRREMGANRFAKIDLQPLPPRTSLLKYQGLLYLPNPYVVPGGRFNEMYGWDSYFIQLGLLRDNLVPLARDMSDNFLYEIHNYGMILNANRTYYLTRSQPPFLTEMVLNVFKRTHDRAWLESALPEIEKYYRFWTREPHLTTETGLSRYFDSGEGPAPEVLSSERDAQGRDHYDAVREFFRTHKIADYDVSQYYDAAQDRLTPLFYKADRSMRESGFDPSDRFGPFNLDIIHYDPVCLNSLLYVMEEQTVEILRDLNRGSDASEWDKRARARAAKINELMWDGQDGLYYDYDFETKRLRRYAFLTTFYPLWAGIASPDQAGRVRRQLPLFERTGGLQTSNNVSGSQWDAPFGWAPLELIAVEGLRRYGYNQDADRISEEFLSLVMDEYQRTGTIVEKYDVVHRGAQVQSELRFGYRTNEAGFGWTNAAFTALFDDLPPEKQARLRRRAGNN